MLGLGFEDVSYGLYDTVITVTYFNWYESAIELIDPIFIEIFTQYERDPGLHISVIPGNFD